MSKEDYVLWSKEEKKKLVSLLSNGKAYPQIAASLKRPVGGVEKCCVRLRKKFKAINNTHLVAKAIREKFIQ